MSKAEKAEVTGAETFMTPKEFESIIEDNVSGIVFSQLTVPEGDFQRLPDISKSPFDPFDHSTYRKPDISVKKYNILVNPNQEETAVELSFLRQISKIRSAMQLKRIFGDEIVGFGQKEMEAREIGIASFHSMHSDLVSETLNSYR